MLGHSILPLSYLVHVKPLSPLTSSPQRRMGRQWSAPGDPRPRVASSAALSRKWRGSTSFVAHVAPGALAPYADRGGQSEGTCADQGYLEDGLGAGRS